MMALIVAPGCDRQATDTPVIPSNEVADAASVGANEDAEAPGDQGSKAPDYAGMTFKGTPHDQEHHKVLVSYHGDGAMTLFRNPGSRAVAGEVEVDPGVTLDVKRSRVIVNRSQPLILEEAYHAPVTPYDPNTEEHGEPIRLEVGAGETLYMLKYATEGSCYAGYDEKIYLLDCSQHEAEEIDFDWWILIEHDGARGWVEVDYEDFKYALKEVSP